MNVNCSSFAPCRRDSHCDSRGLLDRDGAKSDDFCTSIEFAESATKFARYPTRFATPDDRPQAKEVGVK